MPRYNSQNLAAIDPEYRRQNNLDSGSKRTAGTHTAKTF